MIVKLLTEQHLEFLSLKRGCTGSSESTLVKCHIVGELMPRTILCHFNSFSRRKVNKYFFYQKLGVDARKPVIGGLRITKAQASLRIRAVGSTPLFFAYMKVSYQHFVQAKFQFSS